MSSATRVSVKSCFKAEVSTVHEQPTAAGVAGAHTARQKTHVGREPRQRPLTELSVLSNPAEAPEPRALRPEKRRAFQISGGGLLASTSH